MTIRTTMLGAMAIAALAWASPAGALAQGALYGAIAYSPDTGAHGYSYNYQTKTQAENEAMRNCNKYAGDCVIATTFSNACGAVAAGRNGWGADWGQTGYVAQQNALAMCSNYTTRCEIVRWQCTD